MAEERPPVEMSQPEPLSVLWRVLSAPQTLLVLMGLLALTLVLGTWIPQIPPEESSDPQAWLAAQPGLFGQLSSVVRTLGLYDLYRTFCFRLLLVLSGLAIFVRAVDAAELALQATGRRGRASAMPPPWQSSLPPRQVPAPLPLAEVRPRIEEWLAGQRYRHEEVQASPESPAVTLIASHRAPSLWLRPVGYAALLLALAGLFVAGSWGWQDESVQLLPGEVRSAGHGTSLAYRLDSFRLRMDRHGHLAGYESEITWLDGQAEIGREAAGIGRPARQSGLALHQAGFVPSVQLSGQTATGQPLRLEGSSAEMGSGDRVLVRFALPDDQPLVFVPLLDRFVALTFEPECDGGRPAVHLDLIDADGENRQRLGSLGSSGTLPLGDGQLSVELSFVPVLRLESRPALALSFAGALVALLALGLAWALPPRLAWLGLAPAGEDGSAVGVTALPGAGQREWLAGLAGGLEEALQDGD